MTKPELDISIERWAAEYREQAHEDIMTAALSGVQSLRHALPENLHALDPRPLLLNDLEQLIRANLPDDLSIVPDIDLCEWARDTYGSEIKSYFTWVDTVAQDEMSEEAYAEWKGAGL